LIKHNDDFASKKDITKLDKSVLSGKTIESMSETSVKVWKNGQEEKLSKPKTRKKKEAAQPADEVAAPEDTDLNTEDIDVQKILKKLPASDMPTNIKPMLASLV